MEEGERWRWEGEEEIEMAGYGGSEKCCKRESKRDGKTDEVREEWRECEFMHPEI